MISGGVCGIIMPNVRGACAPARENARDRMGKLKEYKGKIRKHLREWVWLSHYIRKYWVGVTAFVVIGLVAVIMGLLTAVASKNLIDAVTAEVKDRDRLFAALGVMAGLAVGQLAFRAIASWITAQVRVRVMNEVRQEVFERIMLSRWEALREFHSGEILNRLEGDVGGVVSGIINFLPGLLTQLVQFIGAFVIILYYDWVMALFALASAPILVLSAKPLMKIMRRYNEQTRKINGEILSFNEEAFQNIQLVKAFDLAKQRCRLLKELLEKYKTIQLSYAKMSVVVSLAMGVLGLIAGYGCYGWAIYRLWTNVISYGQMTMFLQLSSNLSSSFSALTSMVPAAVSVATAAGRIMEVTEKPAETDADARPAKKMLAKTKETGLVVEARDMSFTYEDGKAPVMSHVSFKAQPGEILAFVGPSGGGKTTLASLIARFYDTTEGKVCIGGVDVKDIPSAQLMNMVSFVFQDSKLLKMSIYDNVRMGKKDATREEVMEALKNAQCEDIIAKLPDGVDTVIGSQGTYVSGGEAQRLSVARAMLKNAPILILDEATAFADPDNEAKVRQAFTKLSAGKTVIMIAHRLSSVVDADRICVLKDGGIVEQGTHEALLTQGGLYAHMWEEYNKSVSWKVGKGEK